MQRKSRVDNSCAVAREQCAHHWIIETPNGPTSRGVCRLCGAETEFSNYLPHSKWEEKGIRNGESSDLRGGGHN